MTKNIVTCLYGFKDSACGVGFTKGSRGKDECISEKDFRILRTKWTLTSLRECDSIKKKRKRELQIYKRIRTMSMPIIERYLKLTHWI